MRTAWTIMAATCLCMLACTRDRSHLDVAVVPKGTTHEFWKAIHAGALAAAGESGAHIHWKGPPKEDDLSDQIRVVESFISKRVDGIVLAPLNQSALTKVVAEAASAGIPVVVIDSDLDGSQHVSFVATDNRRGGELAAERLGTLVGERGRIIVLRHQEGHASTTQREAGFLETIAARFPNITIVSQNQYGGPTSASSQKVAEGLLARHRDAFDGVFASNESATFGMLLALEAAGLAGKVRFVGFDSSEKLVSALQGGALDGLVVQNPYRMGLLGVQTLVKHLKGEPVERRIDTGVALATRENMDAPDIRALLKPDLPAAVR